MMKKQHAVLLLGAAAVLSAVLISGAKRPAVDTGSPGPGAPGQKEAHEIFSQEANEESLEIDSGDVPLSGLPVLPEESGQEMDGAAYIDGVLALVNAARAEAGLSALMVDETLCGAADIRAKECLESFSHTRPDGSAYKTAITGAGITAEYTGENLAVGHTTAEQVIESWLRSEGHRANILGEHYTRIGISREENTSGRYRGYTWVQLFAS